jgi:hypothetical protein
MVDRGPDSQVSFVAEGDFGSVLGHGTLEHVASLAGRVLASVHTSLEEHQDILGRLPALSMLHGLTRENAQKLLDVAADTKLGFSEAWSRINHSD